MMYLVVMKHIRYAFGLSMDYAFKWPCQGLSTAAPAMIDLLKFEIWCCEWYDTVGVGEGA